MTRLKGWMGLLGLAWLLFSSPLHAAPTDCVQNGGQAICTAPMAVPATGVSPNRTDADGWSYSLCDDMAAYVYRERAWCEVRGGTWVSHPSGPQCVGLNPIFRKDVEDKPEAFAIYLHPPCGSVTKTDTQWGATISSYQCWSGSPTYKNGTLIRDYRTQTFSGISWNPYTEQCSNSWTETVHALAVRDVKCPTGYNTRLQANGDLECWKMPCCGVSVGNPIDLVSGAKKQTEVDFSATMPGGVELVRQYDSQGYYREPGSADERVPPWRFSYDRRIYPIAVSAHAMASARRPNGQIKYFNASGAEVHNVDGGNARLSKVFSGQTLVGWTYTSARGDVESYSATGRLMSITTREGVSQTLAYTNGQLVSVTDSFGRQVTFQYDDERRVSSAFDPSGQRYDYAYDDQGNMSSVKYPDQSARLYTYTEAFQSGNTYIRRALSGVYDEEGALFATWGYDTSGRAVSSVHAGNSQAVSLQYQSDTRIVATDALGAATAYTVTTIDGVRRDIARQTCTEICTTATTTYDSRGNVASRTDANGNQTLFTYDLARNLEISRTEAVGTPESRTVSTNWHPTLPLPASIEEQGRTTSFTYDANGNLLRRTVTDTATGHIRTWAYTYDGFGRVLTENGPRSDVADISTYSYYPIVSGDPKSGLLHQHTDAEGLVTTYSTYDLNGRPLTVTDANGAVTTLSYTARGWLQSEERAGETTSYAYYKTGLIKRVTQASGAFLHFSYNDAQQLVGIEDAAGNRVAYTLDAAGNILREDRFDPLGQLAQTRSQVFDSRGQLHQTVGATNGQRTTFGYDHNGNLSSITDPLSYQTRYGYDALNRQASILDPGNGETHLRYDSLGRLIKVIDPRGLGTQYGLDGFGNGLQLQSPDTGTTASTFDAAGNLKTRTDAKSQTATYSYDKLNRLTEVSHAGGPTVTYRYDEGTYGKGQLTSMSDASGHTSWAYDVRGRLLGKTQASASLSLQTLYVYDPSGQLSQQVLPSGHVVAYQWSNGQLQAMSLDGQPLLSQITHHPFGGPNGWIFGNGENVKRDHDLDGRIIRVSTGDLPLPTGARDYRYDANNRLTQYSGPGGATIDYEYDATGNRTRQATATVIVDYTIDPDSNRISGTQTNGGPAVHPSYDANGSTTQEGLNSYVYDGAGRLVSANGASYLYNGHGQRTIKTVSGVTTHFVYDEQGQLIGEYDELGHPIQETVWLGNLPVAVIKPAQGSAAIYYVHADHLGTPRSIDDSQGQAVWAWDTITFGASQPDEDPRNTGMPFVYNLRFPGQYYDAETGLHQNHNRDYSPPSGRYIQSDPIGLDDGINTYAYAGSDPLSYFDPDGESRVGRRNARQEASPRGPVLRPERPAVLQPWFTYSANSETSCGVCVQVYYVAQLHGTSRSTHRRTANEQFFNYLNGSSGPMNRTEIANQMGAGRGQLRNPEGYQWHHPVHRPGEVWLITRCEHMSPANQQLLHPQGIGGFGRNFKP